MFHGFIFDLDDTIFDLKRAFEESFTESISRIIPDIRLQVPILFERFKSINKGLWEDFEANRINTEELKLKRFEELSTTCNLRIDRTKIKKISDNFIQVLALKTYLMPHAASVLEKMSRSAVLGLITNGDTFVQKNRLVKSEIDVFFQTILISDEIALRKPNPDIFLRAAEGMFLPVHEILVIGDTPGSDIRGGFNAGMKTCWLNTENAEYPENEIKPDYTISDLKELFQFLPEKS